MPLIWQQVVMPCYHFFIFHKFFGRYFDRDMYLNIDIKPWFQQSFITVQNVFFVYLSRFQKDLLCVGNCAGFTEIVKYAFHYNGDCLFENFIHYFWRHTISNFVHFSSKSMYIIMVERGRINIMQKFFKI